MRHVVTWLTGKLDRVVDDAAGDLTDDDRAGIVSLSDERRAIQDDVIMREVDLVVACARDREVLSLHQYICQKHEGSLVHA